MQNYSLDSAMASVRQGQLYNRNAFTGHLGGIVRPVLAVRIAGSDPDHLVFCRAVQKHRRGARDLFYTGFWNCDAQLFGGDPGVGDDQSGHLRLIDGLENGRIKVPICAIDGHLL